MVWATDYQAQELSFRVTGRERMKAMGDGVRGPQDHVYMLKFANCCSLVVFQARKKSTRRRSKAPGEGVSSQHTTVVLASQQPQGG